MIVTRLLTLLASFALAIGFSMIYGLTRGRPVIGAFSRLSIAALVLLGILGSTVPARAEPTPILLPKQGCTTFYAYDGQVALGGNNEDFNNPLTVVWFIPASQGKYGRVYFGFDDTIPQGGMNDQGLFFDAEALSYKAMPEVSARRDFPGGPLAWADEALATSATVQDVIDLYSKWNHPAGEYAQQLYGDRFGNSVIFDGDRVLPKQGAFQVATNFRLVDNPNPPYPDERYGVISEMLSKADRFTVDLFRQALDAGHAEGDFPTVYSQVYELNTGVIHLYQYHDFQQEVVINLADELAKGPHAETIASLFSKNPDYERWAFQQVTQWRVNYEQTINAKVEPASLVGMSGEYTLQEEADAGPVKVYLENNQLYLGKPNQLPVELYPTSPDTVFHHYYNGEDLTLTFERNLWGQVAGAQGSFNFQAYNLAIPYHLTRTGVLSYAVSLAISVGGVILAIFLLAVVLRLSRRMSGQKTLKAS